MIRSLVIRQVFRLLDVSLAIAVLVASVVAVRQFLTPIPELDLAVSAFDESSVETANLVRLPGARRDYDALSSSGLFGAAGRWDPKATPEPQKEPEPEVVPEIVDSSLNLKLKGTIALEPGDPFSVAFIEDTEKRGVAKAFTLGQNVVDNVVLEMVHKREVILLNNREKPPKRERLRMDEASPAVQTARAPAQATSPSTPQPPDGRPQPPQPTGGSTVQNVTLSRSELVQDVMANFSALENLRVRVAQDDSGNPIGLTVDNISEQPLAKKYGFEDGDVLQTINNERVDSEESIMEVFQKYQNASSFRVGIFRNGQPQVITYRLD